MFFTILTLFLQHHFCLGVAVPGKSLEPDTLLGPRDASAAPPAARYTDNSSFTLEVDLDLFCGDTELNNVLTADSHTTESTTTDRYNNDLTAMNDKERIASALFSIGNVVNTVNEALDPCNKNQGSSRTLQQVDNDPGLLTAAVLKTATSTGAAAYGISLAIAAGSNTTMIEDTVVKLAVATTVLQLSNKLVDFLKSQNVLSSGDALVINIAGAALWALGNAVVGTVNAVCAQYVGVDLMQQAMQAVASSTIEQIGLMNRNIAQNFLASNQGQCQAK